jgi:hypothetical protein
MADILDAATIRVIRYDVSDGSVNDARTIHTLRRSDSTGLEWQDHAIALCGPDDAKLAWLRDLVGGCEGCAIDRSGDFVDRIEILDADGDPAGAIVWGC